MRVLALTMSYWLLACMPLRADEPPAVELLISPRAIESPVMKYRLLPAEADLKPGNAAMILLRLPWEQRDFHETVFNKLDNWQSPPGANSVWKDTRKLLPDVFYDEMKRAAFRRDVDWGYPIGEQPPYAILLPDVQGLKRVIGLGLSVKTQFHLSRGDLDLARETILIGFANGRHLSRTPFFVNQSAAANVHTLMLSQTTALISQPNSPNLYWALSTLPDSLLQFRRAADFEGDIFTTSFPVTRELDKPRTVAEWLKMAEQLVELLEQTEFRFATGKAKEGRRATLYQELFKVARSELPRVLLLTPEKVAAMSDEEAGIRWYVQHRLNIDQRTAGIFCLPPSEAIPQLQHLQAEILEVRKKLGFHPEFLNPLNMYLSVWKINRQIQVLRVVEAVRHYMASHDRKLPEQLSEIENLPVPLDPFTGKPFEWQRAADGTFASLKASPLAGDPGPPFTNPISRLHYRIRVRKNR